MIRRVLPSLALVAVLTVVLYAGRTLAPPSAEATLPPSPPFNCPSGAGGGTVQYFVKATLPAGASANGVCITLIGTGGTNNSGVVVSNPPGCPAPTAEGAGTSDVWADWGLAGCVDPGETVTIRFRNGGTLALGVQPGAATWNLVGGGTATGAVTVSGATAVGGVAEPPASDQLATATSDSGGNGVLPYAGGGAAALLLMAGVTGVWYVGRRRRA